MRRVRRILVIQTAFIGDVILTLPLMQVLKEYFADSEIDVVAVPRSAEVCRNHPAIRKVIRYDKHGGDRGVSEFIRLAGFLREQQYDLAVVPHRSLRSSLLAMLSGAPIRIGFTTMFGRVLLTKSVKRDPENHEIERNLSLLTALGISDIANPLPHVFPGDEESRTVDAVLAGLGRDRAKHLIALAPGTVWNTKRWTKEGFAALAREFIENGFGVALVGGPEDSSLCEEVKNLSGHTKHMVVGAGTLSLLESAELIRRCQLVVSNDSAPMHLGVAVGTPVVAIFGATIPQFGFAPYGPFDSVVEVRGLSCRPCSIHGGPKCPIKTFVCMKNITHERVFARAMETLEKKRIAESAA